MDTVSTLIPVSAEVLDAMLSPYLPDVRYLQSVLIEVKAPDEPDGRNGCVIVGHGEFVSPMRPWYIRDTGHFNAMEFNLCFNQIAYSTVAQCVAEKMIPSLRHMDFGLFRERQLSHMLITRLESRFRKPMQSGRFSGEFVLDVAVRHGDTVWLKTRCSFGAGGITYSSGKVDLAILDCDMPRP
jgi:hypothetical protein